MLIVTEYWHELLRIDPTCIHDDPGCRQNSLLHYSDAERCNIRDDLACWARVIVITVRRNR